MVLSSALGFEPTLVALPTTEESHTFAMDVALFGLAVSQTQNPINGQCGIFHAIGAAKDSSSRIFGWIK